MIQFLSAKTCPSAFGPFHTLEYLQNFKKIIWNSAHFLTKTLAELWQELFTLPHISELSDQNARNPIGIY